jgi:hypothetical protein
VYLQKPQLEQGNSGAASAGTGAAAAGGGGGVEPDSEREQCDCTKKRHDKSIETMHVAENAAKAARGARSKGSRGRGGGEGRGLPAGATSNAFSVTFFKSACGKWLICAWMRAGEEVSAGRRFRGGGGGYHGSSDVGRMGGDGALGLRRGCEDGGRGGRGGEGPRLQRGNSSRRWQRAKTKVGQAAVLRVLRMVGGAEGRAPCRRCTWRAAR